MTTTFKGTAPKKGEGGDFALAPAGNHPAVLVAMIDLGIQQETYNGESREVHQVYLVWELTSEQLPGSQLNFTIGKVFTLSFHEKAGLRQMAEKWRGKQWGDGDEIDYGSMLGRPCLLTVTHQTSKDGTKTYHKMGGVAAVPKGLTVPKPKHTTISWQVGSDTAADLPGWLPRIFGEEVSEVVGKARGTAEASNGKAQEPAAQGDADEAPF